MSNKSPVAQREERVLAWWKEQDIFKRSIEQRAGCEPFVFYEGPPTANAKAGLHHMIARAYKDVVIRYKTMRGFEVKRRAGWDTHGLPVEVQVEKQLGLNNKKEIENLVPGDKLASIAKFNESCRSSVWSNIKEWEYFTERMGYWLDLTNAYITYEKEYVERLWQIVKKVYSDGRLVKSHKVVPFCPRCGTPLSSHEVAQEYKDIVDKTVFVKFPVTGENKTYLLAWTTTPWTLPGNIALAVGENIKYILAKLGEEQFYVAADLADKVLGKSYELVKELPAGELVGKKYEPPFAVSVLASQERAYQIIAAPFVTTEEGTGIVHTAAMYGVEDYEEAVKQHLPRIHTVTEDGKFINEVPQFGGRDVFESTDDIINYLKESGRLLRQQDHKHSYPFCWRCKSKLIYYAKDSWFVTMSELKEKLVALNDQVNWVPEHIKNGRYGEWLRELRDWSFSRNRYWGTPLPVWTNKETGKHLVVGSVSELRELAEDKAMVPEDFDPHRPNVDAVVLIDADGLKYHFEEVICDVWFDSGAMPFASGEDEAGRYPADYISEAIDQTRGWFYTLQAVAALENKTEPPYKNVICLGHINDEHGKKMSKSLGNIIDPLAIADQYGMDAARFYLYSMNQPGQAKRFSEKDLLVSFRQNQQILDNVVSFYLAYVESAESGELTLLDQWILERRNELVVEVSGAMDNYDITGSARLLSDFITDLSQWYLRRSRDRKTTALFTTLKEVIVDLVKMLAPFTPFLTDDIWQQLKGEKEVESVHLANWPVAGEVNQDLLNSMMVVRSLAEKGHALRQVAKIKVRQPLASFTVTEQLNQAEQTILAEELNVESIVTGGQEVALDTEITEELRQKGDKRELVRAWQDARRQAGLTPGQPAKLLMGAIEGLSESELTDLAKQVYLTYEPSDQGNDYLVKLSNQEVKFSVK